MDNLSIEAKISSLNNIQGIINRLADTSSKVKGLYITVMSAILTIVLTIGIQKKPTEMQMTYVFLTGVIFAVIFLCFLIMDCYYLYYERVMRKVYDAKAKDKSVDGSKETNYFEISNEFQKVKKEKLVQPSPSTTQMLFYSVPFILTEVAITLVGVK